MESLYPIRLFNDHAYAIVDYDAVNDLPRDWPLIPLVPQGLDDEKSQLPALLPIATMTSNQRMQFLEMLDRAHQQNEALPVVTFIDSEIEPERMRIHWVKHLIVTFPARPKFLLRSHDPRVLTQLEWMCTPTQLRALVGPIRRWTVYLDRRWRTVPPPSRDSLSTWTFGATQAQLLARIQPINMVLYDLPDAARDARVASSRQINALLDRAQRHRLTNEDDAVQFALHGMRIHPEFDRHPDIANLLADRDPEEQSYGDVTALLDEAFWERIRQDMKTDMNSHPTGTTA